MTWLVQLFLVEACAATAASKNVGVTVEVRTQWRSSVHSTLIEAAEHLEEFHGSETFWKLVDTVERGGPAWRKSGLLDAQAVCTAVAPIVDDMALAIMNVSLSARAMAPRVQFFSSIAAASRGDAACATFATVNGAAALCDAKSVASALGAANGATGVVGDVTLFPFDHIYPAESNGAPLIAVYGRLGSPSLSRLHAAAAAAAAAGKARYVLRLTLGEVVESDSTAAESEREIETVALGGFGIALDIKSMEYKALDDSAPLGAMDGGDEEQGEGEGAGKGADEALDAAETVGVVFATLARRYPHLDNELRAAKETLATSAAADALASAEGGEDLKVWDMTDLGLQATQRVMAAADPLAKLREIAQNFPAYAKQVRRVSSLAVLLPQRTFRAHLFHRVRPVSTLPPLPRTCVPSLAAFARQCRSETPRRDCDASAAYHDAAWNIIPHY
jgi:UDP-glucose:glycoprotein glucosyltransferase